MAFCQNCGSPVVGQFCQNCGQAVAQTQAPPQPPPQPAPGQVAPGPPTPGPPAPAPPPKGGFGNMGIIIAIIVVVVIILAALLLVFMGSQNDGNGGVSKGLTVEMTDTDEMELHYKWEETGNDAEEMREDIDDDAFGDEDGRVTSEEVENLEEVFENWEGEYSVIYLSGKKYFEFGIDGWRGEFTEISVSITGAEGDVDSDRPITITISFKVKWDSLDINKDEYELYLYSRGGDGEDFSFTCPSGYEVSDADGLEDNIKSGETRIRSTMDDDTVQITISKK
ncbi:MAG: zinc ribbon domain-containing protein [Thermoplasmata archaeon]|nr:MAG: zinc ribbon domain-containing protein [Thermoplasmata archaeon]